MHHGKNLGLTATLNRGLELACGEYIARMDCDDISLPDRLEKQVAFLDAHPEVGVCGAWVKTIGSVMGRVWKHPTDADEIRCKLFFESVLVHPSVIMRSKMLQSLGLRYDSSYKRAQDYEFWVRVAQHMPLANLGEILLLYRVHENQVGKLHDSEQIRAANQIRLKQLLNLGLEVSNSDLELNSQISRWLFEASSEFLEAAEAWLMRIFEANRKKQDYNETAFNKILAHRWWALCFFASGLGLCAWKRFWHSPLSQYLALPMRKNIFFLARSLVKYGSK